MRLWRSFLSLVIPLAVFFGSSCGEIIELKEENWDKILTGEWMLEFYAPWCPACRALQSSWAEFGTWSEDLNLNGIAQIDVTKCPGLSGRFMVIALPTIFHVINGEFRQYRGARDKDSFISFIEEKKWKNIETVSSWKDPRSIQMTVVSYFFKMSMLLRNVHTMVTEDFGLPYWASYIGFALATIVLGAFLGLILVLCIDLAYLVPKRASLMVNRGKKLKKDEDKVVDGLVDQVNDYKPTTLRKRRAKKAD